MPSRIYLPLLLVLTTTLGCSEPSLSTRAPAVPAASALSSTDCVDIRSTLADDEHIPASSALVWFEFENRCDQAVEIDWRAVAVTGFVAKADDDAALSPVPLVLRQPASHPIAVGRLDGQWTGSEALRFDAPDKDAHLVDRVCIDLTRVARSRERENGDDGAAAQPTSPIVCVRRPGDRSVVDMSRSGFREAHEDHTNQQSGSSFGMNWNTRGWPRMTWETGLSMHSIGLQGVPLSARGGSKSIDGSQIGDHVRSVEWDMRAKGFVHGPFYLGLDLGVGFGGSRSVVLTGKSGDAVQLSGSPSAHLSTGAVVGVAGRVGHVQPFAELGGGVRGMLFSLAHANGQDVMDDGKGCSCAAKIDAWWGTITPRAGVDLWVLPNMTLGGFAAVDVLHRENISAGLLLGIHTRAFDGR